MFIKVTYLIGNDEISDWSKKKVVDFEAPPAMSLGYDNLLFPFVIIIGGAAIAGQEYSVFKKKIHDISPQHLQFLSSSARW